jgi:4-amino-4-deoxy-L-arabinose transferase-like glycosyltransferase
MPDWRLRAALGLFALVPALYLALPRLDSDQAITGLMGLHVLQGEFPIFFWRQDHAGVPEAYGAAVSFFLFGASRRTLGLVPAAAAVGLALALYRTGTVLFGRPAGLLAIPFATVVAPYVATHYVLARAYYIEHLLAGQLVLLGAALWLARPLSPAARARAAIAMGLAGGFGLYMGFQIVTALVPAALALLLVDPRLPLRRSAWLGLGAFLLGSLPFWIYNLVHDWATFETGARFQGHVSAGEAARALAVDLLPALLGVQDYVGRPRHLPGPLAWTAPALALAAVALLAGRVARGVRRVREDAAVAGEALLLAVLGLTLGLVWWGRYTQVPRYLLPLMPPLALVLARACQLVWRRSRPLAVAGAALYLGAVGVALVGDLTILWPSARAAYRDSRAADEGVLAFLRARGIRHAYAFDYWYAPRMTFDARETIIVAQPHHDRYLPYTLAVDRVARPAYVVGAEAEVVDAWFKSLGTTAHRARVGPYTVFWGFTPPPPVTPLPRVGLAVRTSDGRGAPESLLDGQLDSGWRSGPGPPGSAWVDIDLGQARAVAGLVLVTDQPVHVPAVLEVRPDGGQPAVRLETRGFTTHWRHGAPRAEPSRVLTVRFGPVVARRLRLTDLGPAGAWAVAELFVLAPADAPPAPSAAVEAGRRLEAAGKPGPALARYREAMRRAPDDPEGYAEFTRLGGEHGLLSGWPAARAARHARLGLLDEARRLYVKAGALDTNPVRAELAAAAAAVLAALGDEAEARELLTRAEAARAPRHRLGTLFGRVAELAGYDLGPSRLRPGDTLEMTYHWRLLEPSPAPLTVYVHFAPTGPGQHQFGDDHPLPDQVTGLPKPQTVAVRRQVVVPDTATPGIYQIVVGVWDRESGQQLRRWVAGLVPVPGHAVELGRVEVLAPGTRSGGG